MRRMLMAVAGAMFALLSAAMAAPPSVTINMPGKGQLLLTPSPPSIVIRLNTDALIDQLKAKAPTSGDITVSFKTLGFNKGPTPYEIEFISDLEGAYQGHHFKCYISARVALPATPLLSPKVQDLGGDADCAVGGALGGALGIGSLISSTIAGQMTAALKDAANASMRVVSSSDDAQEILRLDESLADFLAQAMVQLADCSTTASGGICLRVEWPADVLNRYIDEVDSNVPKPKGAIDRDAVQALWLKLRPIAPLKTIADGPSATYSFPAKRNGGGGYDDGDMAIFGGLICAAGMAEGCELVRRSQGPSGQWWRSPARIGEIPGKGQSQFSGDQLNGVISYFLNSTNANQRQQFADYLSFIEKTKFNIPPAGTTLSVGYKSCLIDADDTCALIGQEWFWLNLIANKLGVNGAVPAEERDPLTKYGYSLDQLQWTALVTPQGYRLHLIGVQLLHAKAAGIWSSSLARVAKSLVGRQPNNPFFLYLNFGKDALVQDEFLRKCQPSAAQSNFDEWSWERQETKAAWNDKMIWDCLFIGSLLLQ